MDTTAAIIAQARRLMAAAEAVRAAQEVLGAAEAAEESAYAASVASGSTVARGSCGWCPARGMSLPAGHPLCACGTPRGSDCTEVGHAGAGAKGVRAGAIRHTRTQLAEAQTMAARTAEAAAAVGTARAALYAIAGETAGVAALRALAHGERQAVAMVALLLGLPALPEQEEERPAAEVAEVLPSRRSRKAAQPVPSIAAVAVAQGARWAQAQARATLPAALAVAAEVRDGGIALWLLWADLLATGFEEDRRAAEAALRARDVLARQFRVA